MYDRISELCDVIWSLLTDEERATYAYGDGTIEFVSDVCKLIHEDVTALDEQEILNILEDL